jgi:hypothetical protein
MSLTFEEVNCLGNIINDTFGKSSTGYDKDQFESRYGSYSQYRQGGHDSVVIKASLEGNCLCVTAVGIYNLGPHSHQHQVISTAENELNQHINKKMSFIKNEFKKKEFAGRALKTKELKDKGRPLDIQDLNHYAETRPSYIYRRAYFEVS